MLFNHDTVAANVMVHIESNVGNKHVCRFQLRYQEYCISGIFCDYKFSCKHFLCQLFFVG